MKKIIAKCCETIMVEKKDLKEGIFKKKGYEFEWEMDCEFKFPSMWSFFWGKKVEKKSLLKRFKLQEDIKLKYTICPICGEKVWMGKPINGWWILKSGWKCIEIKSWETDWEVWWI